MHPLSIVMNENTVILAAKSNIISLEPKTENYIYRGKTTNSPIFLKKENGSPKEIHPGNPLVSGKSRSRPNGVPYIIEVRENLTVKFKVFDTTNPVRIGSHTTTNNPRGIVIDSEGSTTNVDIGDPNGNKGIRIQIKIPEKSRNDKEGQVKRENSSAISTDRTNKEEKGKTIHKGVLNEVKKSVDRVYEQHPNVPTINDLSNQMYKDNLTITGELVIYEKGEKQYTVKDLVEAIERLSDIRERIPADEAHQVSTRPEWNRGLKNYITREGQLRRRIGNLYLYNENNNLVLGDRPPREEQIDKIVD